ncbi:MAG: hypothetical protein NWQ54_00495 [Paraglaciecola sp.]|uniref:group II intron maturase-specific domain-containing protein n=1 Tax=Paraglaciecola sp. TaxID=1920173 RepID=UPI00273D134F|nr:group II intron maturase-specific domain-containing protein [Paraglaciecola sp.]MDP5033199.1 hypothetical protein [Paraglaciecola sp.]MDP5129327.1 hypothetical protein [Paraglaciecola sp.]
MRFKQEVKHTLRSARGWSIHRTVEKLNLKLRGWITYYRHITVRNVLLDLDGWLRRHLRKIAWRQWKRVYTRIKRLIALGIDESRAATSAVNGRGAWFNSGASHMNQALPKKYFDYLGLVSLIDYHQRLKY